MKKQWYYRLPNHDNDRLPVEDRLSGHSWEPVSQFPYLQVEVVVSDGGEAVGVGTVKFEDGNPVLVGWASHLQWETPELSFH